MNRWKTSIQAIMRIAREKRGQPEGDVARKKLDLFLNKYPQAKQYAPVREFTLRDVGRMKMSGISTSGSWTGRNLDEAVAAMIRDYQDRLRARRKPPSEADVLLTETIDMLETITCR